MVNNPAKAVNGSFEFASFGILGRDIAQRAAFLQDPLQDELVLGQVDTLRRQIDLLNASPHPDDREILESIEYNFGECDHPDLPEELRNKLGQQPIMDWLVEASTPDLIDLLRWNASRMKHYQARFDAMLPDLEYNAVESTDRLIKDGLLPQIARPLMRQVIAETQVVPLDSFEAGKYTCSGYYDSRQPLLGITHEYFQDSLWGRERDIRRVHLHELFHGLHFLCDGGFYSIVPAGYGDTPANDTSYTWLNELWVEHQALAGENGEPLILSPRERYDMGSYENYRILGSLGLREGSEVIPLELLGHAFLEPAYDPGKYRKELFKRLCSISADLGLDLRHPHFVGAVARSLAQAPRPHRHQIVKDWVDKIHAARGTEYTWEDETPTEHATIIITREVVAEV